MRSGTPSDEKNASLVVGYKVFAMSEHEKLGLIAQLVRALR